MYFVIELFLLIASTHLCNEVRQVRESTELLTNDYRSSLLALGEPERSGTNRDEAVSLRNQFEQIRQEFEEKYDGPGENADMASLSRDRDG